MQEGPGDSLPRSSLRESVARLSVLCVSRCHEKERGYRSQTRAGLTEACEGCFHLPWELFWGLHTWADSSHGASQAPRPCGGFLACPP